MTPPLATVGTLAYIGMPGPVQLAIFAVIVLVLFGNRLPATMRSLGRSVGELKKGLHEGEEDDVPETAPAQTAATAAMSSAPAIDGPKTPTAA